MGAPLVPVLVGGAVVAYVATRNDAPVAPVPRPLPAPGATVAQKAAAISRTRTAVVSRAYAPSLGADRASVPGSFSGAVDPALQAKLALIEAEARKQFDGLSPEDKQKAAAQLNRDLGTNLKGDEDWKTVVSAVTAGAGGTAGLALGGAIAGPLGAKVGALAGAYLGAKLGDLISKTYQELRDSWEWPDSWSEFKAHGLTGGVTCGPYQWKYQETATSTNDGFGSSYAVCSNTALPTGPNVDGVHAQHRGAKVNRTLVSAPAGATTVVPSTQPVRTAVVSGIVKF